MKYLIIVLIILGFIGPAFGQSMGDISDKIWLPNCPIGTSIECDQASLFPDAIALPFFQSDSVAIGTIVEKDSKNQDSIRYSIDVDFYLKNYQPFDLIAATLNDAPEPQTLPEVFWYNSPVFNEGDLVFVYLKKIEGGYRLLPESFALDKHEVRGPPPTIHWNNSPSEGIFDQGEKILVSGEVRKMELVKAVKEGKQLDAKLMLLESHDRDSMVFSDIMEIGFDGNYNYSLDTSKLPPGSYELEVNYGPSTYGTEITIEPNFKIWTPLKQISMGISMEKIQCRENLVLVEKYDGSPACVKSVTKQRLMDRGWAEPVSFDEIKNNPELLKQNIIRMEDGRISLYPENTCASIDVQFLADQDIQRYKNDDRGLNEDNVLQITSNDFNEIPIVEELIFAVNLLEFPYNQYSSAELDGLTFVEYEFFLMEKAIEKYGDSQSDYFIKLDRDYEERFSNPVKQGFTNTFEAPLIIYDNKTYSIGSTVFWVSDEHEPMRMTVYPIDEIKDKKFIELTDEDIKFVPKIKQAIKDIGTVQESINGRKGLPEDQWNEYREWFALKSQDQLGTDSFRLIQYNDQLYSIGFGIC